MNAGLARRADSENEAAGERSVAGAADASPNVHDVGKFPVKWTAPGTHLASSLS